MRQQEYTVVYMGVTSEPRRGVKGRVRLAATMSGLRNAGLVSPRACCASATDRHKKCGSQQARPLLLNQPFGLSPITQNRLQIPVTRGQIGTLAFPALSGAGLAPPAPHLRQVSEPVYFLRDNRLRIGHGRLTDRKSAVHCKPRGEVMLVEGSVGHCRFRRSVLCTSVALFSFCDLSGAHADWAETLGIGQKSTNLGGAVSATSDDYDAFFTNPAGAANFGRAFFGAGVKFLDVRGLNVRQTDATGVSGAGSVGSLFGLSGPAPLNGLSLSPVGVLPGATVAALPSFGAYSPLPGYERVVVGLGVGSPFNVASVYGNTGVPGNYGQFNTTSAGLAIVETSPTIAVKVTDRLNLGASVGITTMKYLQMGSVSGAPTASVGPLNLGNLGALGVGTMNLQTGSNIALPGGPSFATGPIDVPSVTLGAQYKFTDTLTGGVTWRSKTPETFTGTASLTVNPIAGLAQYSAADQFSYKVDLPQDVQAGLAYDVTSRWKIMGDVRWTNWSGANGFGSPGVISFLNGTINPGAAIVGQAGTSGTALLLTLLGVKSAAIQSITTGYQAHDTYSFHFGTSYKLTPNFELQAGYVYDPSFISGNTMDLTTLSSNRHIFSLGGTYTVPSSRYRGGEWAVTAGAQLVDYENRHIALGESTTLGGVNGLAAVLKSQSNLQYSSNTLGGLDIGGYVWSAGLSITYKFGVGAPLITK